MHYFILRDQRCSKHIVQIGINFFFLHLADYNL